MNKHSVIVIIALIVISSAFGFSGWNVFAADQLQIQGPEGRFSYYEMMSDGKIVICNPLPLSVTVNKFDIKIFFENKDEGTYSIKAETIPPSSSNMLNGTFKSEIFTEAQYLFLHFDSMFSGTSPLRIDPNKFSIVTVSQTPIIGIIPYSVSKQYSGLEFWSMMNGDKGEFNC